MAWCFGFAIRKDESGFTRVIIQLPLVTQKLDKVESYLLTLEEALGIARCMQGGGARGGPLARPLLTRGLLPLLTLHSMCI